MTVELRPETERAVREAIQAGHFRSVDEIILRAIQSRRDDPVLPRQATKGRAAAIARIRGNRKDNRLPGGASISDLLREGRA